MNGKMHEKQNPFDHLFDQIAKLLEFVKTKQHAGMKELPPDIEKRLDKLTKQVDQFNRLSKEVIALSDVSAEELKMRLNGTSTELPPEGKRLIERGRQLKEQVQDYHDQLEHTLKNVPPSIRNLQAKADQPVEKVISDEEYTRKRRSKFKRFGSNQKWKPL